MWLGQGSLGSLAWTWPAFARSSVPPARLGWVAWWSPASWGRGLHKLNPLYSWRPLKTLGITAWTASLATDPALWLLGSLVPWQLLTGHGLLCIEVPRTPTISWGSGWLWFCPEMAFSVFQPSVIPTLGLPYIVLMEIQALKQPSFSLTASSHPHDSSG